MEYTREHAQSAQRCAVNVNRRSAVSTQVGKVSQVRGLGSCTAYHNSLRPLGWLCPVPAPSQKLYVQYICASFRFGMAHSAHVGLQAAARLACAFTVAPAAATACAYQCAWLCAQCLSGYLRGQLQAYGYALVPAALEVVSAAIVHNLTCCCRQPGVPDQCQVSRQPTVKHLHSSTEQV